MAKTTFLRSSGGSLLPWLALALIILIADQFTKVLILGYYKLGDSTYVTSFFNVVRVHNTGAAFSFLASASGWQRWFFTGIGVAAALFIVWMLRAHPGQRLFSFALACILGGAIGSGRARITSARTPCQLGRLLFRARPSGARGAPRRTKPRTRLRVPAVTALLPGLSPGEVAEWLKAPPC